MKLKVIRSIRWRDNNIICNLWDWNAYWRGNYTIASVSCRNFINQYTNGRTSGKNWSCETGHRILNLIIFRNSWWRKSCFCAIWVNCNGYLTRVLGLSATARSGELDSDIKGKGRLWGACCGGNSPSCAQSGAASHFWHSSLHCIGRTDDIVNRRATRVNGQALNGLNASYTSNYRLWVYKGCGTAIVFLKVGPTSTTVVKGKQVRV